MHNFQFHDLKFNQERYCAGVSFFMKCTNRHKCEVSLKVVFQGPYFSIYMLQTCLHLHEVPVFNLLTIRPCIKDVKLKIYLIVLTLQNNIGHLKTWSDMNSLVFNGTKTKIMIFSTRKMSRCHPSRYLFSRIKWK